MKKQSEKKFKPEIRSRDSSASPEFSKQKVLENRVKNTSKKKKNVVESTVIN